MLWRRSTLRAFRTAGKRLFWLSVRAGRRGIRAVSRAIRRSQRRRRNKQYRARFKARVERYRVKNTWGRVPSKRWYRAQPKASQAKAKARSVIRMQYVKGQARSHRIYGLARYSSEKSIAREHARENQLQWYSLSGEELSAREVVELHRQHPGRYTYMAVLSPSPEEAGAWNHDPERINQYVRGVLGHQHTVSYCYHPDPHHPHVHVILESDHTFSKNELQSLRERSDEICRVIAREVAYEQRHHVERNREWEREREEMERSL